MIGCNLTVGVRWKPNGTQLKMELGKAGGVLACYPGGGGRQARGGGGGEEEDAIPHRVQEERDYNDKCTDMTLVGEENKPEEGGRD